MLYTASSQRPRTNRSERRAVADGDAPVSAIDGIAKKLSRLQPNPAREAEIPIPAAGNFGLGGLKAGAGRQHGVGPVPAGRLRPVVAVTGVAAEKLGRVDPRNWPRWRASVEHVE